MRRAVRCSSPVLSRRIARADVVAARGLAARSAHAVSSPRRLHERQRSLEALGALVKDGKLDVEADLVAGSVPAIPKYALEVQGSPKTSIRADAANGRVTH